MVADTVVPVQRSGIIRVLVCTVVLTLVGGFSSGPASATAVGGAAKPSPPPASTSTTVPIEPKAYVVLDADTGAVVVAKNDRTPLPPASLTKVLTAVAAAPLLDPAGTITVSERAAAQPANKVGALAGQEWSTDVAMNVMLMQSSNDLAMAVAEGAGGSAEGFQQLMARAGERLGLADGPILRDPAGLDDDTSMGGGNLISARDLAIVTRALLAHPWLGPIVATRKLGFTDPAGVVHEATNHNKLLLSGGYPGAIGVKTGFTRRAGRSLIGAARKDGRTMIAVVLNVPDTYGWVSGLLDQGFATSIEAEATLPRVASPVHLTAADLGGPTSAAKASKTPALDAASASTPPAVGATDPTAIAAVRSEGRSSQLLLVVLAGGGIVLATVGLLGLRRRAGDDYRVEPRRPRV